MFLLNKIKFLGGLSALALLLNACSTANFPEFGVDNEENVAVSEGGRVTKKMPEAGKSLKADTKNVAYEGQEDEELSDVEVDDVEVVADNVVEEETVVQDETVLAEENAGPSVSYRMETFYFDNGSASLSSKYNAQIKKIVKTAKENKATVMVYGYASSRTRNTDVASHKLANFKVSMERATSVAAALKRAGMPADKIVVEALSDTVPAYVEVMPEGERLNRRAEVYISY